MSLFPTSPTNRSFNRPHASPTRFHQSHPSSRCPFSFDLRASTPRRSATHQPIARPSHTTRTSALSQRQASFHHARLEPLRRAPWAYSTGAHRAGTLRGRRAPHTALRWSIRRPLALHTPAAPRAVLGRLPAPSASYGGCSATLKWGPKPPAKAVAPVRVNPGWRGRVARNRSTLGTAQGPSPCGGSAATDPSSRPCARIRGRAAWTTAPPAGARPGGGWGGGRTMRAHTNPHQLHRARLPTQRARQTTRRPYHEHALVPRKTG